MTTKFGEEIKKKRLEKGLTQKELAEKICTQVIALFTFIFGIIINNTIREHNEIETQRMKPLNYSLNEKEIESTGKIKGNGMTWVITQEGVKFQIKIIMGILIKNICD